MRFARFVPFALTVTAIAAFAAFPGAAPQRPAGLPPGDPASPAIAGQRNPGGPGRGGPGGGEIKLVKQFDRNKDGRLDREERREARAHLDTIRGGGAGRGGGMAGPMGRGGNRQPGVPGAALTPSSVKPASTPLYDPATLRTVFFEFDSPEWESELLAFHNTDVEVPATMTLDGVTYKDVGIHFRGASSFMMIPAGLKHSLNVSIDFVHEGQNAGGYRTLNLLNSNDDPTFMRSILYYDAARSLIPAPKANHVRVAINGESWGVYVNVQQFNKDFIKEWFNTTEGARWKVPGSPGGRGGLEYLGEDVTLYKRFYEIKSKDDPKSWEAFVTLCRVLNETPIDKLEAALAPILDVDGALKFLALDNALVNNDGYWVRASDYSLYLDPKGRFHVMPQDANETFGPGGGPGGRGGPGGPGGRRGGMLGDPGRGMGGDPGRAMPPDRGRGPGMGGGRGPGGGGVTLDPLVGLEDATKPLRSRLLAVPALRDRYLKYVRDIATTWLDWKTLDAIVQRSHALIAADVKADTRKLDSFEAFEAGVQTLKSFAERRREFLLNR